MAVATLRWSDWDFQPGVSARMTWDVVSSVPADVTTADGVFQAFATHPLDASLVAEAPSATREGPTFYRVSVSFRGPTTAAGGPTVPLDPDPLKQPPSIRWNIGTSSEAFNRDIYGNLIVNSAGDAIANPLDKEVISLGWTVVKNFRDFDASLAVRFMGTVNENPVTFLDRYTFPKGQVLCRLIAPTAEYTARAKYVPVAFSFEARADGWAWRLPSLGRNGWYKSGRTGLLIVGPLYYEGHPVNDPVPLTEDGRPRPPGVTVTESGYPPQPRPANLPAVILRENSDDGTLFLKYDRYPFADFGDLPL